MFRRHFHGDPGSWTLTGRCHPNRPRNGQTMARARGLTLFSSPGQQGAQLEASILRLGKKQGYRCRVEREVNVRTGMRAQCCDDVVVYDLTTDGRTEGAYRAFVALYSNLDHVLVVSRTPLPFNILPARPGGAPPYPYPLRELPDGTDVLYAPRLDGEDPWTGDESLLRWLRRQLEDLAGRPVGRRLPRRPSFEPVWPTAQDIEDFVKPLPGRLAVNRMHQGQAFVSYRGSRAAEVMGLGESVTASATRLHVVAPGELALERELMSAHRRWAVVAMLRLYISSAAEFWVYGSADYRTSWWTLAELVLARMAIMKRDEGRATSAPRIRVLDPLSGQLREGSPRPVRVWKRQWNEISQMCDLVQPGVSWPPFLGPGSDKSPRLPVGVGGRDDWAALSDTLMIDRRTLQRSPAPYRTSAGALLKGLRDMVHFDTASVAAAAASRRPLQGPDGHLIRVAELPPRLAFSTPRKEDPANQVLHVLPTYYALG